MRDMMEHTGGRGKSEIQEIRHREKAPVLRLRLERLESLPEDALAVLAQVQFAADVNPFGGASGFETQLVEGDVVDEPVEPFVEC